MRVLWVCNIMLPAVAAQLGRAASVREGWLSGLFGRMLASPQTDVELGLCFPVEKEEDGLKRELVFGGQGRKVCCYGFGEDTAHPERWDEMLEVRFSQILLDFSPDLVHIFGTEFPHAYACARAFGRPERTLVGLQGLMCACADAYMADLPPAVQDSRTLRDILKQDSIRQQQKKFYARAAFEERLLKETGHVTGRTPFDRETVRRLNPDAVYHFMNETMRPAFYEGAWSPAGCRRFTIFVSQADYPLKGFHYLLQAMEEILRDFPETEILVAGNSVLGTDGWKGRLKIPAYGSYLRRLIRTFRLQGKIRVLGRLEEAQMRQAFLSCHVFLCPSAMENSPNSVGEAQLLGVPVAASDAGGIPGVVEDGVGGLLFAKGDVRGLAQTVKRIFSSDELAESLSCSERRIAAEKYDGARNFDRLLEIYGEICGA